eukprot:661369-Prymnesium_polylepis.1
MHAPNTFTPHALDVCRLPTGASPHPLRSLTRAPLHTLTPSHPSAPSSQDNVYEPDEHFEVRLLSPHVTRPPT